MDLTQENSELFSSLVSLIRDASSLYSLDVGFLRSIDRTHAERSEEASNRLLNLINTLVKRSNGGRSSTDAPFENVDDVLRRWKSIEQTFDLLIDKIDSPPKRARQAQAYSKSETAQQYHRQSSGIAKPQASFATKVDNSVGPFRPLLTQKPFATVPLNQALKVRQPDALHEKEWYEQPYKEEIANSVYPDTSRTDGLPKPNWESTPFLLVDTPQKLQKMISKLQNASVIAVDVEHHDYRSYLGLVCLLQISASGEDFVIDALALRAELQELNKVFADPKILKVLHGATMDIQWLQRDLGVYIVGLFDTFFASRALGFPKHSLAYLLQTFAGFEAQKKYQLADWRVRPLPQELVDYARADTHFLLYIFYLLRDRLQKENKYEDVLARSREVAGIRYEKPGWNESEPGWVNIASKYRIHSKPQLAVLVKLFEWRDLKAREADESPRYVMTPQLIANLCISAPETGSGVITASHIISPIVRNCAEEIARLIHDTKKNPDSVNTTVPAKKIALVIPEQVPSPQSTQIAQLRSPTSSLLGDGHTSAEQQHWTRPDVYLGIIDPKSLKAAQTLFGLPSDGSQSDSAQDTEMTEPVEQNDSSPTSNNGGHDSAPSKQPQEPAKRGSGRRINIVDSADDIDHGSRVSTGSSQSTVSDMPAFDFANAGAVLQQGEVGDKKSYHRFNGKRGRGPQGERGGRKSMAKFNRGTTIRK